MEVSWEEAVVFSKALNCNPEELVDNPTIVMTAHVETQNGGNGNHYTIGKTAEHEIATLKMVVEAKDAQIQETKAHLNSVQKELEAAHAREKKIIAQLDAVLKKRKNA